MDIEEITLWEKMDHLNTGGLWSEEQEKEQ
jgi:hypothetical protein